MTEAWRDRAACAGEPTWLFFPERGETLSIAKEVCARCPVSAECLAYALTAGVHHGVWGGKSEKERRRMLRGTIRPPVELVCRVCGSRFLAGVRSATYCSKKCRQRTYDSKRKVAS